MLNNYFTALNNISMTKRAAVVHHLRVYKYAQSGPGSTEPPGSFAETLTGGRNEGTPIPLAQPPEGLIGNEGPSAHLVPPQGRIQAIGKDYAPAVGRGAASGALAGIPIALLVNALFGKDKGLRGSLRAALMGGLVGGGAGALGGAGGKYMYDNVPGSKDILDRVGQGIYEGIGLRPGPSTHESWARSGPLIENPIPNR